MHIDVDRAAPTPRSHQRQTPTAFELRLSRHIERHGINVVVPGFDTGELRGDLSVYLLEERH